MINSHSSFSKDANNYFIKDLGILGSSTYHTKQALDPVEAASEPSQDKNEANIL